jgi:hypothetical protein
MAGWRGLFWLVALRIAHVVRLAQRDAPISGLNPASAFACLELRPESEYREQDADSPLHEFD